MNRDLFLAILALDSYNRGYGQRLAGLSDNGKLGRAEILYGSEVLLTDELDRKDIPADFYAVAYEWNGETIISYRGGIPGTVYLFDAAPAGR